MAETTMSDIKRKRVSVPGGIPDVINGDLAIPPSPPQGKTTPDSDDEVEEEVEEAEEPPKKKASPDVVRMPWNFSCPCQRFNADNPEGSYFYWCNFHQRKITNMFA